MSRIGKQIIEIPSSVEVKLDGDTVTVKSSKGELTHTIPQGVTVLHEDNTLRVQIANEEDKQMRMFWGTTASILSNMVTGVTEGFTKELEVNGVGFKVALSGSKLNLSLGFSHPIEFEIPKGVTAEVEKNSIKLSGIDKQLVGQVASKIRGLKKPEPYKGKGIKYKDEVIRRKAGKAAGAE